MKSNGGQDDMTELYKLVEVELACSWVAGGGAGRQLGGNVAGWPRLLQTVDVFLDS